MRRLVHMFGGPGGLAGAILVLLIVANGLAAPWIAPYNPTDVDMINTLAEPSPDHWFGTDQSGRDVLSRVIWGGRASLEVSALAVVVGLAGGITLGLLAGFFNGGWLEQIVMRTLDAMAAIPLLIWAIALVGILGVGPFTVLGLTFGNEVKLLVLLGVLYIPTIARIVHTGALGESRANYVAARRLQGVGSVRIMVSDVLPNCLSPVIVQATLLLAIGIIIEASVSFVGLGVQPPAPSWGNMLADARNYLFSGEWWLSVFPGAAISVSVIAFNLLGDGLRDALDPRHTTQALTA
ncbi:MAG TPA: ABC transporter permease [Rhodopila sp.]|uniref:ABC transporter permease n=1 Tax=Rhodopila sp. TaxID=2480087 RepID=UPI002C6A0C2F|nr:ABC transporter permease [Rhodopila sp.]HVY14468.1 ABC transporter permease [Rhodopila sp.]